MIPDPEVEALLNDLPPTKLPQPLIDKGWGSNSMHDDVGSRSRPSDVQQPEYDRTCFQCGRPITNDNKDHAGKRRCDRLLVGEDWIDTIHLDEDEYRKLLTRREWAEKMAPLKAPPTPKVRVASACDARTNRGGHPSHEHVCFHPADHFGFHECGACRHLWR